MSYILDALRRADAQRQRDPARGIHAQPPAIGTSAHSGPAGRPSLGWIVAFAAVVVTVAGAVYLLRPAPAGQTMAQDNLPVPSVPQSSAAGSSARTSDPTLVAEAPAGGTSAPPASVLLPPAPPMTPVVRTPAPRPGGDDAGSVGSPPPAAARRGDPASSARPAAGTPQRVDSRAAPQAEPAAGLPGAPAAAQASAPAEPAAAGVPRATQSRGAAPATAAQPAPRQEPPPGAPPLVVTGGVYSANPAQRMLIVNGQVFNEGAQPAPGVMLEEIRSGSAVLSFGGARFSLRY